MDELGVKLNDPVSSWNLDSGKSNVPGYTTETHSPLLAGTASSILNVPVRETNIYAKQHLTCYLVIKT
jgi:hypothetical protein